MLKVFISNISFDAGEKELRHFLHRAGVRTESVTLVTDRESGKSKGFAFVECSDEEAFENALKSDGETFFGRRLNISRARESCPRGRPGARFRNAHAD